MRSELDNMETIGSKENKIMIFQDNIVREYLKNVYFITGTPCGGKTTISRALSKRFGIPVYDIDERFEEHRRMSDPEHQPSMNREFRDADEFFGRSVEEYKAWLLNNTREQLDFVIMDMIRLAQEGPVLCDCHLTLEQANTLSDPSHIAFLIKEPKALVEDYCNRPDHQGFQDFIHSATDYEKAKETCNETLLSLNLKLYQDVKQSRYFWLERDNGRSVEETVALLAEHFGFECNHTRQADMDKKDANPHGVVVTKIERDSELAGELLRFVENCSWTEAKEHLAKNLREWIYEDWEAVFVAVSEGRIIGMTSVMKTDYYPLPEICPWVSGIFVEDGSRGNRISGKMIDAANKYLKEHGFEKSYIPSEFKGFYEKYGYHYLRDIINYGGGTDHLYIKML